MIGIFDSGSGGLTVLYALRKRAPRANLLYFGDVGRAPYGEKSKAELAGLVTEGMQLLQSRGATELVSACNSVSHSVLEGAAGGHRVIEMTRPTARMMRRYAGARVLLIATPATIASRIYRDALSPIVSLDELAIPGLAGAIESEAPEDEVAAILRTALSSKAGAKYDTVLLGCTHYPFVRDAIAREAREIFGAIELVDPADAVAEEVAARFSIEGEGTITFLTSKDTHGFRNRIAPCFLESECTLEVI